jgi:hypothetical protein
MQSAFGIEHGAISKVELPGAARLRGYKIKRAYNAAKKAGTLKPVVPVRQVVNPDYNPNAHRTQAPTGPGSARSYMSGKAMETQDTARRRT